MISTTLLNNNIEILREKLNLLLLIKEPTDDIVVNCSQELDKLIVEYEKHFFSQISSSIYN